MQDTSCEHFIPSKIKVILFLLMFFSHHQSTMTFTQKSTVFFLTEVFSFSYEDLILWWCAHGLTALFLAISTRQTLVLHTCVLVFNSKPYSVSCYQSSWGFNHDPYHSLSIFNIFLGSVHPNSFFMDFLWKKCKWMCNETWQFQHKILHVHSDEELGCVL